MLWSAAFAPRQGGSFTEYCLPLNDALSGLTAGCGWKNPVPAGVLRLLRRRKPQLGPPGNRIDRERREVRHAQKDESPERIPVLHRNEQEREVLRPHTGALRAPHMGPPRLFPGIHPRSRRP